MKSKIVIGTWPLSGDYGNVSLKHIQEVLEYSYQVGFREYDTAPNYGNGFMEFCLGNVFKNNQDILINTKIGNLPFHGKSFAIEDLRRSFNESLKRLQRDSVNVLFLHNPRVDVANYVDIIRFLNELKKNDLIKFSGLSKARDFDYQKSVDLQQFDALQDDVNLLYLEPIKNLKLTKTIFMARSPLASGLLSGKLTSNTTFPKDDHRSLWLKGERLLSLLRRIEAIKKNTNLELARLAMRFLFYQDKIDKIICGVKKIEHVNDIVQAINDGPLEPNLIEKLVDLYENDFYLKNEKQYAY